jgi:hypothetical protein
MTDASTGKKIETIEPPGGLDITLWQRRGDPRQRSEKFYEEGRTYNFDFNVYEVKSYINPGSEELI